MAVTMKIKLCNSHYRDDSPMRVLTPNEVERQETLLLARTKPLHKPGLAGFFVHYFLHG